MRVEALRHDFRTAWIGLRRSKGFTAAAVLTLTIGIAATTVMFALIEGVLLRPLPVRDQGRVIVAWKELRSSAFAHYPFGGPDVEAVARTNHIFEAAAGVTSNGASPWVAVENGVASYVTGALVTGGFFDVLGVYPILGRALTPADDLEGAENVVVITHALWQRRYGGSPDVVGRGLRLAGIPFSIVGVMPPDLDFPSGVELWRTVRSADGGGPFGEAARYELDLVARLRAGVTVQQAQSELQALTTRLNSTAPPDFPRDLVTVLRSFEDVVVGAVRQPLLLLFGAVGLVLLIASANAANLLLMRGESRQREIATRAALGADRARIVRALLAEGLLLAGAAGAAGLALAWVSLGALMTLVPDGLPRVDAVRIDPRVVLFTTATSLLTAVVTAIGPARSSARNDLVSLMRAHATAVKPTARRVLVAAQVAFAVVIVALSGLLIRSLLNLRSADMGLSIDRVVFVDLAVPPAKVTDRARHEQFLEQVVQRLDGVPAIAAATPINVLPFSGTEGWDVPRFTAQGQSPERAAVNPSLNLESIHPSYFETLRIPVLRGRAFSTLDKAGAAAVAIVSADVAARTWPGEDPIGKRLKMGGADSEDEWRTVVGIAAPTRYRELEHPRPTLYLPAAQFLMTARTIAVRSAAPADEIASFVRSELSRVDPDVQVLRVTPFAQMLDVPLARPRFYAFVLAIFGLAALALATIGIYAVIASNVRRRRREIGIRIALGASRASVRRLVVGESMRLSGAGASVGLLGALAATRLVRGMVFEVNTLDPSTLAAAAVTLVAASLLAALVAMRRALDRNPAAVLRAD